MVEFFRKPPHKDTPGWRGPARITDCTPETTAHGTVGVNWQGLNLSVRIADLRRALVYLAMMWRRYYGEAREAPINLLRDLALNCTSSYVYFGWVHSASGMMLSGFQNLC